MGKSIAFLRAINVGGHVVKMSRLKELFETMALTNVETFIASGNVIFDTSSRSAGALEQKIEKALEEALGYSVGTFLRTPKELAGIVDHADALERESKVDDRLLYLGFLKEKPGAEAKKRLSALESEINTFHVDDRELYWLMTTRSSDSGITGPKLEKALGQPTTLRNSTTVRKLAAKYS